MRSAALNSRRHRVAALVAVVFAAVAAAACAEKLDGGANCAGGSSLLCPNQTVEYRDTIIDPTLEFDSTYIGFPSRGSEFAIPLVAHGNEFESVAIIRFDTLTTHFLPPKDTVQAITYVDSSMVKLHIDLTRSQVPDSVRIDLYDVNTPGAEDTATAPVLARFVPQFKIGGKTFGKTQLVDSIFVPLSDSAVLARLADSTQGQPRLRIGVRVSAATPVSFRIGTVDNGNFPELRYRPKNDTAVHQQNIFPSSAGPADREDVRRDLMDYSLVLKNTLPTIPGTMALGGVPGRRVYLRFNLPRRLTDSTTILRATLRLNQVAYPFGGATDTVVVRPHIVLAGPTITDYRRASTLIGGPGVVLSDSLVLFPNGSGVRELEMYALVRAWGAQGVGVDIPPRAVVLSASNEGTLARVVTFSSSTASAGLRPRMRITYIPKTEFGVP
jgi:hypothetical protein